MSEKYPGGLITKTPVTPAGPYQTGAASGVWTRDQQLQYQQQGIWPTAGLTPNYIEDVFSTYLYTGTGATQSIVNGINLSGKGGLVWIKDRSAGNSHQLADTARGNTNYISSDTTAAQQTSTTDITSFNSNGFTLGTGATLATNDNGTTYVSWTFRKQAKFFDVVTYTGTGAGAQTVSHNLGSTPGFIIVKNTSNAGAWWCYHSGITNASNQGIRLNSTAAASDTGTPTWYPTSTTFSASETQFSLNTSGNTYVAYLFASNAGGFGATGTDNVISCGSYTTNGAGVGSATLGWEPQWLLLKVSSGTGGWVLIDNMRGFVAPGGGNSADLLANTADAESSVGIKVNATGFTDPGVLVASGTVIYIAIRRGPMKTPTDATTVFSPIVRTGTGAAATVTGVGFSPDWVWARPSASSSYDNLETDKLRGTTQQLATYSTMAELSNGSRITGWTNDGFTLGTEAQYNANGLSIINWCIKRAPGFFDVVCWTGDGTGSSLNVSHNLGTIPLLLITKKRSTTSNWVTNPWNGSSWMDLKLNTTAANAGNVGGIATSTTFNPASILDNVSGTTYVTYLFATCPGVSKVGTYTGNGTTQTIDCGFTGGARFVLIKRTDSTGDWYTYDTARGMTTLTDPYLLLNSTAAETATLGSVTTVTTGFAVNASILAAINTSAATYIFLAIA